MSFLETPRFPTGISYGATGGPGYNTDVVVINSGYEQRNANWAASRATYDVTHGVKTKDDTDTLIAFFRNCKGRAHGFRFKDWADFTATHATGVLGTGVGSGALAYHLNKKYVTGALTEFREITKPTGAIEVKRAGSIVTYGVAAGNISIDSTTGIITFVADSTKTINANVAANINANVTANIAANLSATITGITQANPAVVTATAHGFVTGEKVRIAAVGGMTQVNNLYFTVTYIDANSFSIGVNSTAYGAYTSGGTAIRYGVSQTNLVRVQCAAHAFINGDLVYIAAAGGMTQVNGITFTVVNSSTNYFELTGIDGTAYTLYTSGGTVTKYGATKTNLVRIYSTAHPFIDGDLVYIAAAVGMVQINDITFTVVNKTTNYFELTGINGSAYTLYTSGGTITKYGATKTSPVRIYSTAHGIVNGKQIEISGVVGMTQLNLQQFTVTNSQTNYFDLTGVNGLQYTLRTSGGTISLSVQSTDTLTWSGEFDVPCRFDTDQMKVNGITIDRYTWDGIPITEIRI